MFKRHNMWLCFTGGPIQNARMFPRYVAAKMALVSAFAGLGLGVDAQQLPAQRDNGVPALPSVTVTAKANRDPVEKSYRKMVRGMELFEKQRSTSPNASLRFKLLPRRADTDMNNIQVDVIGPTVDFVVQIAPDHTFALPRNQAAFDDDAQVIPNRKKQTMTWRSEIRTPGLPPNTRRLGDLRLECRVGMEAGLISNSGGFIGRIASALLDTPAYCDRKDPAYLFFSDRPLFSVTLVAGGRREILPVNQLYAAASDDPKLKDDLPYCDCEVLVDRTYFLPLGDSSWPDDTLVEFDYMDGE
jgi:hypothetical protein